jgi:hypothetical protein
VFERLEDRIYVLIAKAVLTSDDVALEEIASELRAALREHIERARRMAVSRVSPPRRRKTDFEEPKLLYTPCGQKTQPR